MTEIDHCRKCGHKMRLGAMRIPLRNGKRGVAHFLTHVGHATCSAAVEYHCDMFKPYPTPLPYEEMIARWNTEQRGESMVYSAGVGGSSVPISTVSRRGVWAGEEAGRCAQDGGSPFHASPAVPRT